MPTPSQIRSLGIVRCKETVIDACDGETTGCCGIVSCSLCIKVIDAYGGILDAELAPYSDGSYFATVAGHSFSGVWGRDYDGECMFTVTIDAGYGEQVLEFTCYDAPCRAASGEADVAEGTLTWEVAEWIPIARRTVDGCQHDFCGTCGCAPPQICVTVTGDDCTASGIFPFSGDLNDCGEAITVEYDFSLLCGEQVISGTVSLRRNEYTDECELVIAVGGAYPEIVETQCAIVGSATVTLGYSEYSISVTEAPCDFCGPPFLTPCCPEAPLPTFDVTVCVEGTGDPGCDGEYPMEISLGADTAACPQCCDVDGVTPLAIIEQLAGDGGAEFFYHGGGTVYISGAPFSLCVISCSCSDPATGGDCSHLPPEDPDDPATAHISFHVFLTEYEVHNCWCASCSDFDGEVDFSEHVADYCDSVIGRIRVEFTEVG